MRDTLIPPALVSMALTNVADNHHTHPVSFCRTIPPSLPVCLPVLPPSTTNRSSWKNWLTTVCLCVIRQPPSLPRNLPSHPPASSPARVASPPTRPPPSFSMPAVTSSSSSSPSCSWEEKCFRLPSTPATPSPPAASTPAPAAPPSPRGAAGRHPACAAARTRGSCRRRTGAPGAAASGTGSALRRPWAWTCRGARVRREVGGVRGGACLVVTTG